MLPLIPVTIGRLSLSLRTAAGSDQTSIQFMPEHPGGRLFEYHATREGGCRLRYHSQHHANGATHGSEGLHSVTAQDNFLAPEAFTTAFDGDL